MRFKSLAEFVAAVDEDGDVLRVPGADLHLEVGVISEVLGEQGGPLLLFEELDGLPAGHRLATNVFNTPRRFATAMGISSKDLHPVEMVNEWRHATRTKIPVDPKFVDQGRATEVVSEDVDLGTIPNPKWHEHDGGEYIGTGDIVVVRDPDSDWVNLGTYRVCRVGPSDVSIWINPTKHGQIIAQKYWKRGEDCPIAIVLGADPVTFFAAISGVPEGVSEYEYASALHDGPVELVHTPNHGLPVPAHAEIVLEGLMPNPEIESVPEGPFGEWPGYYAHSANECVIHLDGMMRAEDPIMFGFLPARPIGETRGIPTFAGALWDHLERSGITDVTGVWGFCHQLMMVISMRPRYPGHANQALLATAGLKSAVSMYYQYVVVDDDIDPSNLEEVTWAMCTRVDPSTDVQVLHHAWTSGLDPRVSPSDKARGDLTKGRMLVDATRPFTWRDEFPRVSAFQRSERRAMVEKWSELLSPLNIDTTRL